MISLPNTLCECPDKINEELQSELVDFCDLLECESNEDVVLQNTVPELCECPEVLSSIDNKKPQPFIENRVVVCFGDLIKNIARTKFCQVAPKCH